MDIPRREQTSSSCGRCLADGAKPRWTFWTKSKSHFRCTVALSTSPSRSSIHCHRLNITDKRKTVKTHKIINIFRIESSIFFFDHPEDFSYLRCCHVIIRWFLQLVKIWTSVQKFLKHENYCVQKSNQLRKVKEFMKQRLYKLLKAGFF